MKKTLSMLLCLHFFFFTQRALKREFLGSLSFPLASQFPSSGELTFDTSVFFLLFENSTKCPL